MAALSKGQDKGKGGSLNFADAIPKLSLVSDAKQNKQPAGSAVGDLLNQLVPPLSLERKNPVQRVAAQNAGDNNLFDKSVKVSDSKQSESEKQAVQNPVQTKVENFDKAKSLQELAQAGQIVDRTSMVLEPKPEAKLNPGEVPGIKVTHGDATGAEKQADFLIKKDGSVEMFGNPIEAGKKEIVIQYEKEGENFALTDAQKAAGGKFFVYLQDQLKQQFPQAAPDAFKINDSQGLLRDSDLPPEVKKNLQAQPEQKLNPELPDKAGPTMQDTNRISNGGRSSSVPRGDIDNMTPPANRSLNESDRLNAMKDTVASYVTRGEKKPYDYVSKRGDRGWGVGRYGMTYGQVGNWLEGLSDEQIEELIKQGKLSPAQGAKLKQMRDSVKKAKASGDDNDLHPFLKSMKNGEGTAEDMQKGVQEFLPEKVQEMAASDQIGKITGELSAEAVKRGENPTVDPGQLALSFVLGRTVSKQEYEGNADYKQFVESARQAYRMQEQARLQGGPLINVENMSQVSDALNKMVGMQFWREAAGATEYGNKGCAIAVTRALQRMGVNIGMHLDVTGTANDMRRRGWQEVSLKTAMQSGMLYVPVNKETGSHIGLGLGRQIWENSSGRRQFVTQDVTRSSLRHSGRAFIVPIMPSDKQQQA